MADIDVRADVDVLEALEFEPDCDSKYHTTGLCFHNPEQAATWLVVGPCGQEVQRCDSWVQKLLTTQVSVWCDCQKSHEYHELRYIPIGTP